MEFGLSIPNFGTFGDPHVLVDLARRAERAGWDAVFLWDHIQIGHWAGPLVDPWIALAAIATATERIVLGPMVTPLPRRRPAKVAREAVTLDHLSRGRLILGVGIGWPPDVDFGDFGDAADNRTRGAQLDEALEILTGLWSGRRFAHTGEHYAVRDAKFLPLPLQSPRIPIWVGGMWPHRPAFRRAARWDGIYPIAVDESGGFTELTPQTFAEIVAYVRAHRSGGGPLATAAGGSLIDEPEPGRTVARYQEAGATWWIENAPFPSRPLEEFLDYLGAGPPR